MKPNILKWVALATLLSTGLSGTPGPRRTATGGTGERAQLTVPAPAPVPVPVPAEMERGPRHLRQVALTFDAGGEAEGLEDLLRTLEQEQVTATFFLTGKWACQNLHLARLISEQGGHTIGNHTWAHKDLTTLEEWDVRQELLRTDDQFVGWFGPRYLPLFRVPYGETNPLVLAVAQELGFHTIRWSIDTLDAMEPRKTPPFIEERILSRSDEELQGAIVLMHVGYMETVHALPRVVQGLRERGFEFVTLNEWIPALRRPAVRQLGSTLPTPAVRPPGNLPAASAVPPPKALPAE